MGKIEELLRKNLKKLAVLDVDIQTFTSGRELLEKENLFEKCQALFLDIQMKDCNGLEIACQIKEKNPGLILVFVSAYMDYALAGYRVEAFRFLLKDDLENQMKECVPELLKKLEKIHASRYFDFACGTRRVRLENILYIESYGHKMQFHMLNDSSSYVLSGNLMELEEMFREHGFCRIHKSYLVNMKYVENIRRYEAVLSNGEVLPIPKEKFRQIREEYIRSVGEI